MDVEKFLGGLGLFVLAPLTAVIIILAATGVFPS